MSKKARKEIAEILWRLIHEHPQHITLHDIAEECRVGYMTFHRMLYSKTMDPSVHTLGRMLRAMNANDEESMDVLWWAAFGREREKKEEVPV